MKTIITKEMTCVDCGTAFAMDETLVELRRKDGASFYCPNGHSQKYSCSPVDKLKEKTDELKETKDELRDAKAEITRLRCELIKAQKPNLLRRMFSPNV